MATYADDTAILSPGNDPVETTFFTNTLKLNRQKWSFNWKIKINLDKSLYVPCSIHT